MPETDARAALRARQGEGARYDAPSAPAADLLLARRGTAYFARCLNNLTDEQLFAPSDIAGASRAYVVAEVSYAARHQAMALTSLAGPAAPGMNDEEPIFPTLDLAATLPGRALRYLFHHAEIHLNVCWRDLSDADWERDVTLPDDLVLTARSLPLRRAREVWTAALHLGNGARARDIPDSLRPALLG
ncbi:MAG: maleylpyruvate isomerase N-terminal domain-containing protein [Hyphomonas sp.]